MYVIKELLVLYGDSISMNIDTVKDMFTGKKTTVSNKIICRDKKTN